MDIYLTALQFGKYPRLTTSTSVNNCFIYLYLSLFSTIAIIIFTPFVIILSLKYFLPLQDKEVSYGAHAPRILALDDYFLMEVEKTEKDPDTGKKIKKKV